MVAAAAAALGLTFAQPVRADARKARQIETERQVRRILEKRLDHGDYPGAAVAVHVPGQGDVVVAVGKSDLHKGTPLDPELPLNVGSVTKTFVAVVVLQLVQEGKIGLDQAVDKWFPALPRANQITVRHLLRHESGLSDYLESETVLNDAKRSYKPEELIAVAVKMGAVSGPGQGHHYANTNYILLGSIIEKVAGRPWYEEVRARIIEPLEMSRTAYAGEASAPAMGKGYRKRDGQFVDSTHVWHASVGGAAGAMVSTVSDLMRFIRALNEGRLLDAKRMKEMRGFVPAGDIGHVEHFYGLGYERYRGGELTLEGHLGTGGAYVAFIGCDPVTGTAVAVLSNVRDPGLSAMMAAEVVSELTDQDINPPPMPSASVSFQYLFKSPLADPPAVVQDLEVQINTLQAEIAYPISFNGGDTVLTNGLSYGQLMLNYSNRDPAAGELVETAHAINYDFTWHQTFDDTWSLLTMVSPGLASDFEGSLSFDDVVLEAAAVMICSFSESFALGLGGGYNPRMGQQYPMPVLALRWLPTPSMKLESILPMSLSYAFRPHPFLDLGLDVNLEGSSYHGDPDKYGVDNPQMRYSLAKAGPTVTLNFTPWLHLRLHGGYTFVRRFEFYDGFDEQASYDLKNNAYFLGRLSIGDV